MSKGEITRYHDDESRKLGHGITVNVLAVILWVKLLISGATVGIWVTAAASCSGKARLACSTLVQEGPGTLCRHENGNIDGMIWLLRFCRVSFRRVIPLSDLVMIPACD